MLLWCKVTYKMVESINNTKKYNLSRLWVVSELYYPEETSTGYYLTRIAEGLAADIETKAICGQPNYSKRGTKAPSNEIHNGVEIFRAGGTTLDKNIIVYRVLNMLTLGISVFFKGLKHFRAGDMALVVTTPPLLPFMTAIVCLMKGSSYILLIHDNYPEILYAVGKVKKGSFFSQIADFANRWLYKYAAKIIVVGRDMQELISKKTAGLDIPIDYIPNWAELETVSPEKKHGNALLSELGISDKFVFLYAGNMGHPNDLESIVKCAEDLSHDPRYHFLFLGTGVKRKWLETVVRDKDLANITLLDPKPRSEQQIFLNACDVALVSLISKMKGVSMPSRTYNILAAGKPILGLTESGSELDIVIKEEKCGINVPPNDPEELMQAILRLGEMDRSELDQMGSNSRNAALEKYSLTTAIQLYRSSLITKK